MGLRQNYLQRQLEILLLSGTGVCREKAKGNGVFKGLNSLKFQENII